MMNTFTFALIAFVALHMGVSASGLRGVLIARIGAGPYRIAFSLASLALLAWLIFAYGAMRDDPFNQLTWPLWAPPDWLHAPALVLMFVGVALAVAGVLTPGPTLAGFESSIRKPEPARGVLRITRHPFLWGVAFWGAGHALVNGERFALMLFGALTFMVIFGARSIDRKGRARDPEAWERFAEVTSNFPFAAIAQGRNTLKLAEAWPQILAGAAAAAAFAYFHEAIIGYPAL
jgi:uncharacterized membrane protein